MQAALYNCDDLDSRAGRGDMLNDLLIWSFKHERISGNRLNVNPMKRTLKKGTHDKSGVFFNVHCSLGLIVFLRNQFV